MCIIIATLGAGAPSRSVLRRACAANPDGFGWAVLVDDPTAQLGARVVADRSMRSSDAIAGYKRAIARHGAAVRASLFHARIATHGHVDLGNVHPFEIGDGSGAVLAHNGILPIKDSTGVRSDSRVFAEDWLPALGGARALVGPWSEVLDAWVSDYGSKIAVLDPADSVGLVILGERLGEWRGASWYSNSSADSFRASGYGSGMGSLGSVRRYGSGVGDSLGLFDSYDEELDERSAFGRRAWICPECSAVVDGVDALGSECPFCSSCFHCGQTVDKFGQCGCPPVELSRSSLLGGAS